MIVLQGFPPNRSTTNPYLIMLAESLRALPQVEVLNFTWKTAFTGKFDVYHTHWPENLGTGSNKIKSVARQLLTLAFLLRLRITRVPIVRTVHNLERPTGLSWTQRRLLDLIDAQTSVRVRLNAHTPIPPHAAVQLIPHGHYLQWFSKYSLPETIPGRLAFAGLVRRYKGIETLLSAFVDLADSQLTLSISGRPTSRDLEEEIRYAAGRDARVRLFLEFQSEEDFARRIAESELVILPYHLMHNSGGTFAALSLNRPVLIPDNQINRELSEEVGLGWIHLFQGELTDTHISTALSAIRNNPPASPPDLSARSWDAAGERHQTAYLHGLGNKSKRARKTSA